MNRDQETGMKCRGRHREMKANWLWCIDSGRMLALLIGSRDNRGVGMAHTDTNMP